MARMHACVCFVFHRISSGSSVVAKRYSPRMVPTTYLYVNVVVVLLLNVRVCNEVAARAPFVQLEKLGYFVLN